MCQCEYIDKHSTNKKIGKATSGFVFMFKKSYKKRAHDHGPLTTLPT